MSRAIKFRVWDTRGKYFRRANIEGPKNSAWGITIDRGIFSLESTEGLVYQQFTGLLDSNNKEIYEGDIISLTSELCENEICENEICEIKFGQGNFDGGEYKYIGFYLEKNGECLEPRQVTELIDKSSIYEIKVIGNIFQNPELLS